MSTIVVVNGTSSLTHSSTRAPLMRLGLVLEGIHRDIFGQRDGRGSRPQTQWTRRGRPFMRTWRGRRLHPSVARRRVELKSLVHPWVAWSGIVHHGEHFIAPRYDRATVLLE